MTLFAASQCPHCGTYRLVGDPCDCRQKLPPVIIGEGDINDQIRYAIRCVCGEDRNIIDVELAHITPHQLPEGTKLFYVTSICGHPSRCEHVDKVYWYLDRSVVVKFSQFSTTLLGNVIQQLKPLNDS
jgi:hypothetical protein